MKRVKITSHELSVIGILIFAFAVRILLASQTWPLPNSDEATIGLMALHIQHGSDAPIFFYGQHYMGSLEAYIGAVLFSILGASVFTLRLGIILLVILFLIGMYLLTRILYTKTFALVTVLLLSLGSNAVLSRQLSAIGGYTETLFFTVFLFLVATRLALASTYGPLENRFWRLIGYSSWGLIAGLGIWSDLLILPFLLCSSFLLLFCWRDLLKGAIFPLLFCFLIGAFPLISYNLHPALGQNSWQVLQSQQGHPPITARVLTQELSNTVAISIPTITGSPFCHYSEYDRDDLTSLALFGFQQSHPPTEYCRLVGTGWSLIYLFLILLSIGYSVLTLQNLLVPIHQWQRECPYEKRKALILQTVQLLLATSAVITLILYIHSYSVVGWPAATSRYLIGLWLVTPLTLWPLWVGVRLLRRTFVEREKRILHTWRVAGGASFLLLWALFGIFSYGIGHTLTEIPAAQGAEQQEQRLIEGLLKQRITHIYTDYWTCDRIIFESQEKILCAVVNPNMQPGLNRYPLYYTKVSHDLTSAYLFPTIMKYDKKIEYILGRERKTYQRFLFEGYTVYKIQS